MIQKIASPLEVIEIASPCPADWDAMTGNDQVRFCGECKLHIYNLSGMTRPEAETLVNESEGRLCVRFFRRADGTVLTADCPVGVRVIRRRLARALAAVAAIVGFLSFGTLYTRGKAGASAVQTGPLAQLIEWIEGAPRAMAGRMLMGDVAPPPPASRPSPRSASPSGEK